MSEVIVKCPHCPPNKSPKLYINADKGVFQCFRCSNFHGTLGYLLSEFPEYSDLIENKVALAATSRYRAFLRKTSRYDILDYLNPVRHILPSDPHWDYLLARGWTEEMIFSYQPMLSVNSGYTDRVVLPVFDSAGDMIYYVARALSGAGGDKYKNAPVPKINAVFSSKLPENAVYSDIVVLCEGIFDAAKIPSAHALLGKVITAAQEPAVFSICKPAKSIYVALDAGAEQPMDVIADRLSSWFPTKKIYTLDTSAYNGRDLGNLAETSSSFDLISFVLANSVIWKPTTSLSGSVKSKLSKAFSRI